jgi:hypothetical protein
VAPDFGLGAQAAHGVVEHLQHELGIDDLVDNFARGEQVNLRLFHLDDGAARVGEVVQFLVEGVAHGHDPVAANL